MSLIINNLHPNTFIHSNTHSNKHYFTSKAKARARFCYPSLNININSNRRLVHVHVTDSASVNGYTVRNHDDVIEVDTDEVVGVSVLERLLRIVRLIPALLPGGKWWGFLDEVEVVQNAKPVTLFRALGRMWELISNDRWVIFSAFSALIITADINFFDSESIGDLTSRLGSDCQQVSRVIGNDLNLILRNLLQATGALIYLLVLSWPLGLCTLAICTTLSLIMYRYGQYQKKAARLTQEYTASANEVAQETFSLMRTVRVYGTEHKELERYNNWLEKLAHISLRTSAAYGIWNCSFNTLYHSTQVLAVLVGGMSIMAGHITAEQLTKFILYSEWLIYSTWFVGDNLSSLMQSVGASEKVFQMMDLAPSHQFTSSGSKLPNLKGGIELVNVSFSYTSRETVHVLKDITVTVNPYEVVALVGLSGSGKSTIVNLLLRLYEPTSGQILIDGSPLKDLDIKWLRERIGYVGQEPRLFRMDVKSNIAYGCTRDVTQEDIEWAAKQAYAHEFITSLPDGYDTIVDDDLLSGGQKQRIAIARGILRNPSILILDEATSALDAESEYNIKGVLRASGDNFKRTVIIIAHRLSTVQAADKIVVMDRGQIIEMGNHKELLLKDGLYARLTRRQVDAVG
ncbi:hypothetical protein M8C21_027587 [Ambrosia artemisiifolia]|uniref:ABC transporter B family member 26, chloroplastic n=1 Tax=Ambrosia artemisiifolia TaxID=4212 RepID=A0AAD5G3G5_AMBAR|nr:hypothetical protein M8C21_027587 [Ambrosia artemisiifolia]